MIIHICFASSAFVAAPGGENPSEMKERAPLLLLGAVGSGKTHEAHALTGLGAAKPAPSVTARGTRHPIIFSGRGRLVVDTPGLRWEGRAAFSAPALLNQLRNIGATHIGVLVIVNPFDGRHLLAAAARDALHGLCEDRDITASVFVNAERWGQSLPTYARATEIVEPLFDKFAREGIDATLLPASRVEDIAREATTLQHLPLREHEHTRVAFAPSGSVDVKANDLQQMILRGLQDAISAFAQRLLKGHTHAKAATLGDAEIFARLGAFFSSERESYLLHQRFRDELLAMGGDDLGKRACRDVVSEAAEIFMRDRKRFNELKGSGDYLFYATLCDFSEAARYGQGGTTMQRKEIARALMNRTMSAFMEDKDMTSCLPPSAGESDMTRADFLEAALALSKYDVGTEGVQTRAKQFITLSTCYVRWLEEHPEFWRDDVYMG